MMLFLSPRKIKCLSLHPLISSLNLLFIYPSHLSLSLRLQRVKLMPCKVTAFHALQPCDPANRAEGQSLQKEPGKVFFGRIPTYLNGTRSVGLYRYKNFSDFVSVVADDTEMPAYWANFANDFLGERSKLAPISSSFSSLNRPKWRFFIFSTSIPNP
jgi:hypothetical protein